MSYTDIQKRALYDCTTVDDITLELGKPSATSGAIDMAFNSNKNWQNEAGLVGTAPISKRDTYQFIVNQYNKHYAKKAEDKITASDIDIISMEAVPRTAICAGLLRGVCRIRKVNKRLNFVCKAGYDGYNAPIDNSVASVVNGKEELALKSSAKINSENKAAQEAAYKEAAAKREEVLAQSNALYKEKQLEQNVNTAEDNLTAAKNKLQDIQNDLQKLENERRINTDAKREKVIKSGISLRKNKSIPKAQENLATAKQELVKAKQELANFKQNMNK
jgi:hypothetical protein